MCHTECNEPEYMMGSLEAEILRFEDELRGYEGVSRDDCLRIARHFAEWQRMRIAAFIKQLIDEEKEKIKGWSDLYGSSFEPLALERGKISGFSIVRRELINGDIDKLLKHKNIIVHD